MLRKRTLLKPATAGDVDTRLLLHLNGNVTDSSMYSVSTSQKSGTTFTTGKFGQAFQGTVTQSPTDESPITIPNNYIRNLINGNFTIDFWLNVAEIPAYIGCQVFLTGLDPVAMTYPLSIAISPPNANQYTVSIGGYYNSAPTNILSFVISDEDMYGWTHFAIQRYSDTIIVFINGIQMGQSSPNFNSTYLSQFTGTVELVCITPTAIDEFRISSTARYSGDFTPPTAPYTA